MKTPATIAPISQRLSWEHADRYNKALSLKEIAAAVRAELRQVWPECRFSVRIGSHSINGELIETPYNAEIDAEIVKDANARLQSYNYDNSDIMTDYFDVNFHGEIREIYSVIHRQPTAAEQYAAEAFEQEQQERREAEEARREAEAQRLAQEYAEQAAARAEAEKLAAANAAEVEAAAVVEDLPEGKRYILHGFREYRKICTVDEIRDGYSEHVQTVEVVRRVTLPAHAAWLFGHDLLRDWSFLEGQGGTYTNDERISSMQDLGRMTPDERESVEWITLGVEIRDEYGPIMIVDPEGYSYARYVLIREEGDNKDEAEILEDISAEIITSMGIVGSWKDNDEYAETMKNHLLRTSPATAQAVSLRDLRDWILCTMGEPFGDQQEQKEPEQEQKEPEQVNELPPLQQAFNAAGLVIGQQVTVIKMGDIGMIQRIKGTVTGAELTAWAQYQDAALLDVKPYGRRTEVRQYFTPHDDFIILAGFHDLPESVLWDSKPGTNGAVYKVSKYLSCDPRYMQDVRAWAASEGLTTLASWVSTQYAAEAFDQEPAEDQEPEQTQEPEPLPSSMSYAEFAALVKAGRI